MLRSIYFGAALLFMIFGSCYVGYFIGTDRMERIAISKGFGTLIEESLQFRWFDAVEIKASKLMVG